jgi:hypothetical protein
MSRVSDASILRMISSARHDRSNPIGRRLDPHLQAEQQARNDAIGRAIWTDIHTREWTEFTRTENERFLAECRDRVPKVGCNCLARTDALFAAMPPPLDEPAKMEEWGYALHERVKQEITAQIAAGQSRKPPPEPWTQERARDFWQAVRAEIKRRLTDAQSPLERH